MSSLNGTTLWLLLNSTKRQIPNGSIRISKGKFCFCWIQIWLAKTSHLLQYWNDTAMHCTHSRTQLNSTQMNPTGLKSLSWSQISWNQLSWSQLRWVHEKSPLQCIGEISFVYDLVTAWIKVFNKWSCFPPITFVNLKPLWSKCGVIIFLQYRTNISESVFSELRSTQNVKKLCRPPFTTWN